MNKSDRRVLEAMDDRELADIGLTRGDLPSLYAECASGSCSPAGVDPAGGRKYSVFRSHWGCYGFKVAIIKAGSAMSAMLIIWAVVYGVAP